MNKLGLVLAVIIPCVGCAASSAPNRIEGVHQQVQNREEVKAAASADQAAGRKTGVTAAATMTYWLAVKAALRPHPIDPGVAAREIDHLSKVGVAPELVRDSQSVVEKMRAASASIKSISAFAMLFHLPRSQLAEAEALSRDAFAQCQVIERMRADLTARFGVEFPSLELPTL